MKSTLHLVEISEQNRKLSVFRLAADGQKSLLTESELPSGPGWTPEVERFAAMLGENLLMDSEAARRALQI